jgi:uncharacterized MAPEG superfamily protein
MTTDLWMLAWSAVLCLVLPNVPVTALVSLPGGWAWGLGNRDRPFEGQEAAWALRARRAHANLVENLVVFAALVLAAHVAGRANEWTALGSQMFFWGRIGHVITYIAGLVPWRTLAFAVAVAGEWLIAFQLLFG